MNADSTKLKWAKFIMLLAALYNICWGAVVSLWPQIILFGNPATDYLLILIRCIAMLVGVYGIAYYFAALDPLKYWPLILVGWIGKLLGPVGSLYYIYIGKLEPGFLIVNVFNDIIWLYPFGWVIYMAVKGQLSPKNVSNNPASLYHQLLGNAFNSLAPNLQSFHSSAAAITARGEFKVTRGQGIINNVIAAIANLPISAPTADAELVVTPTGSNEVWTRRLANKKVISKQWLAGGLLVERFKVVVICLQAGVSNADLIITDVSSTVLGIPMPPFFTPTVTAVGKDAGDFIHVEVEIGFKPFGRIINYQGLVRVVS